MFPRRPIASPNNHATRREHPRCCGTATAVSRPARAKRSCDEPQNALAYPPSVHEDETPVPPQGASVTRRGRCDH
jgi:hypothetical protein